MPKSAAHPLSLHEEVVLLALVERTGSFKAGTWFNQILAGAVLAELLMSGRIELQKERRKIFVVVQASRPSGDALLDGWVEKIRTSGRRRPMEHWLNKVSGTSKLAHRIAQRLVGRGILSLREDTVFWLFQRNRYPELDPRPEAALRRRLHEAIFKDGVKVEERTVVLLSILYRGEILKRVFGAKEVRARRKHIEALVAESAAGQATATVIATMEAVMIAVIATAAVSAST